MTDALQRMAEALEQQNLLRREELEQAKRDEAAKIELALAERDSARESQRLADNQAKHDELVATLIGDVRTLVELTSLVVKGGEERHGRVDDKIDLLLEMQRLIITRMLRDTSDVAELERLTAILREVSGAQLNVQTGGIALDAARDATLAAGRDVVAGGRKRGNKA
jgi:hypothetical protein